MFRFQNWISNVREKEQTKGNDFSITTILCSHCWRIVVFQKVENSIRYRTVRRRELFMCFGNLSTMVANYRNYCRICGIIFAERSPENRLKMLYPLENIPLGTFRSIVYKLYCINMIKNIVIYLNMFFSILSLVNIRSHIPIIGL